MITSRKELNQYLAMDRARRGNDLPNLKDWILRNEKWYLWRYVLSLRHVEYHKNKISVEGGIMCLHLLPFLFWFYRYKRLCFLLHLYIYPNSVGAGLMMYHIGGFTHVGKNVKIGKNCTILPGVVFGNKHEEPDESPIIVGDNCYFGLGCKILGSVRIGNNVTVGANSVVTKDIPDNAVVGGVPAKVIKIKDQHT